MSRYNPRFICSECGRSLPAAKLSEHSLALSDTDNRADALLVLDGRDVVCSDCEEEQDYEVFAPAADASTVRTQTDYERFIFSGLKLDPARMTAYYLSN